MDSKLNWSSHIVRVCGKISQVSYLFWKCRDMVLAEYLRIAHFGFFQSHIISYSLILWGQSPFVIEMLLVQKKVIKILCKANLFLHHCRPLFIHTQIML